MRSRAATWEGAITIDELGEFGLIGAVTSAMAGAGGTSSGYVLVGAGDDAAVVRSPDGRVVATTDLMLEGRHFRTEWSSAADIGHKAAARNLADVAAMGAVPTTLLVAFAGPGRLPVEWVTDLAAGIARECASAGAAVAGGDTSSADKVLIAITALGDLGGRPPVTRSGARPGDVVAAAGRLGSAATGLRLLAAGIEVPDPQSPLGALVQAHRRPAPPYAAGVEAAVLGATSMIDVSDGLIADLGHVADASGVLIDLRSDLLSDGRLADLDALRRAAEVLDVPDWLPWVLTGGDDHALVATFPAAVRLPDLWTIVGSVVPGHGVTVDQQKWAGRGGWEHFRT